MTLTLADLRARHAGSLAAALKARRPDLFDRLLEQIEQRGFLAEQAERDGSFDPGTQVLEQVVLPELGARGDWGRFLRHALVALNLRELVETLRSPRLLAALAPRRFALAANLAGRLADPGKRAAARAAIAAALGASSTGARRDRGRILPLLASDLDAAVERLVPGGEEAWCEVLCEVARCAAADLRARWEALLRTLEPWPALADRLRLALAAVWLEEGEEDGVWRLLAQVSGDEACAGFVVASSRRFARHGLAEGLDRLSAMPRISAASRWRCAISLLAAGREDRAGEARDKAADGWALLARRLGPVVWSVDAVAAGDALWPLLSAELLEEQAAAVDDPRVRAALHIAIAPRGGADAARACDEALRALPDDGDCLHWSLRRIAACEAEPPSVRRDRLREAANVLVKRRFAVPATDAVRFLELVAELLPRELELWVEDLLWSPASGRGTLLELAAAARHPRLLDDLMRRTERHAAAVAEGEAEGFELRRHLLTLVVPRLAVLRGDLSVVAEASPRLLPEEEDSVRVATAEALLAAGRRELAMEVCDGIGSQPLRRRARIDLRLADSAAEDDLRPDRLYGLVAGSDWVDDELSALAALLEAPILPAEIARDHLGEVRSHGRRVHALVDLAWHATRFEEELQRPASRRDPRAAQLPLREALGVVESDRWLVGLVPDLAVLGACLGPAQAVAELQQGCEKVLAREGVAWEVREEALDRLAWQAARSLQSSGSVDAGRRRAAEWARWLLDLPRALPVDGAARREARRQWHRLLPCFVAAVEAMPPAVAPRLMGGRHRRSGAGGAASHVAQSRRRWTWLGPEQRAVVDHCAASPQERAAAAARGGLLAPEAEALAWLLVRTDPAAAGSAVSALSGGAERDRLCARIARFAAPDGATRSAWIRRIGDGRRVRRATLLAAPPDGLAAVVASGDLLEDHAGFEAVRRSAWEVRGEEAELRILAAAVVSSFGAGGVAAGRAGLRLWLNAAVAPLPGRPGSEGDRRRVEVLERACREARSIGSADAVEAAPDAAGRGEVGQPGSGSAAETTARLVPTLAEEAEPKLHRAWSRAWWWRQRMWKPDPDGQTPVRALLAITAIFVLAPLDVAIYELVARWLAGAPTQPREPPAWTFAVLLATIAFNAVALRSFTGGQAAPGETGRGVAARLRRVLLAVPWFGPFLAVEWTARPPSEAALWLARRHRRSGRSAPGAARRWAWIGTAAGGSVVVLLNFAAVMATLPHLLVALEGGLPGATAVAAAGLAAHGVAYRAARRGFGRMLEEVPGQAGARVRELLCMSWALPVPLLPLLALTSVLLAGPLLPGFGGPLAAKLRRRPGPGRLERPGAAAPTRRKAAAAVPVGGEEARAVHGLALGCQLKMAAALVDGLLLGGLLASMAGAWPAVVHGLTLAILTAGLVAFGVMLLGAWRRLRARRARSSLPTAASSLAGTAIAFSAGAYAAASLVGGAVGEAAAALTVFAVSGAAVDVLGLLIRTFSAAPDDPPFGAAVGFARIIAYCLFGIAVLPAVAPPPVAGPPAWPNVLPLLLSLALGLHLVAGRLAGGVLLLPGGWRDLRRNTAGRVPLLLLVLTAFLPLGGFAIPAWLRRETDRERRLVAAFRGAATAPPSRLRGLRRLP